MLSESLQPGDPMRDDLEEISAAGKRAADLTRQLLAFSRKQILAPRILDLNAVIASVTKMLRRVVGEDVELTVVSGAGLGTVSACLLYTSTPGTPSCDRRTRKSTTRRAHGLHGSARSNF